jgi:pimeloyl-ACP methyl ester carboxylesterase
MKILHTLTILTAVLTAGLAVQAAPAQPASPLLATNVVLVHGAWADGSSWAEVIPYLQAEGLNVTAVQNPLTSLKDSVAATRRVLALQDGPTVLVGHSWGGTVVSEVGADPKVTALVYIAARAPDANENFVALAGKYPTPPARAGIQVHAGFTTLSEGAFLNYFANCVDRTKARTLYAVQWPTAASIFAGRTTVAAWRNKPSWYAVSKQDETINPDLERFLASRMNATTVELDAGHLSLVSHPKQVADLILAAAGRKRSNPPSTPSAPESPDLLHLDMHEQVTRNPALSASPGSV